MYFNAFHCTQFVVAVCTKDYSTNSGQNANTCYKFQVNWMSLVGNALLTGKVEIKNF